MPNQRVMLAAGGTGGHLFPAQALAEELGRRNIDIHLMTDERAHDYGKAFPASSTHVVPSASLSFSEPTQVPQRMFRLFKGYRLARSLLREHKPSAIVGFGGYPSLPPVLAATRNGVPAIIHEQNAVLGRANTLLAKRVNAIATSFANVSGVPKVAGKRVTLTGNPVRSAVLAAADGEYPNLEDGGPINLLVFGGSQGAKFFADSVPATVRALPENLRKRIWITQQCRPEDMNRVRGEYEAAGITANLAPFFKDMPWLIRSAHLVICRSGASSIAELGVIGRPAILVPLPHAIDNDQLRNAESFAKAGGGFVHPQASLNPSHFSSVLAGLLEKPAALKDAAAKALSHGRPDAAGRLADLVLTTMAKQ
jgi:UDP-N-acetylglucosamine--N-acetylmuramyl-(pentapeptide) pyrophosphoryl-undecaprenol N-acetylglucosamine transferase